MAPGNSFTHTVTFEKMFSSPGALEVVTSSALIFITQGEKPTNLECSFYGCPLPLQVHWYKDNTIITNGTEGIYHSEDERPQNGKETLWSKLTFSPGREELEGVYNCSAKNSIPGWQSEVSEVFELRYDCKQEVIVNNIPLYYIFQIVTVNVVYHDVYRRD